MTEKICPIQAENKCISDPVLDVYPWLADKLSKASNANPEDVKKTKENLQEAGYYKKDVEKEIHEYPNKKLFMEIKEFQKDQSIKADGIMKPGGETEKRLAEKASEKRHKRFNREIKKIATKSDAHFKDAMEKDKKQFAELEDNQHPKARNTELESDEPMRTPLGSDIFKRNEKKSLRYRVIEDEILEVKKDEKQAKTLENNSVLDVGLRWKDQREKLFLKKDS